MNELEKYGFEIKTDKSTFNNTFSGKKFNEIHIDTYLNKPYMLFSRIIENNVRISLEDNRIILRDNNNTILVNVPIGEIYEYAVKKCSDVYQYVVHVCGICYKILIVL